LATYICYYTSTCVIISAKKESEKVLQNTNCSSVFSVIFSIFWDFLAVYLGVWYFPPDKNLGIIVLNFPLEEVLFMILVSLLIALTTIVMMERK